ncbi:hypothetical protein SAMN02910456_00393 [Ruminococcaceae bacterium YRB3002]|nr:hypothetical protein SAMN02910456_00393 [Ruminococcaceae bacterium YRB3002]
MRYLSANTYYRNMFGHKMYRISLSLPVTCPNRDGRVGTGGCIFCSEGGSGEFADPFDDIERAISRIRGKAGNDAGYIAFFQSHTNTYCDPGYLHDRLVQATGHPGVEAAAVATRPDCLPDEMISMLADFNKTYPVFVEMGLQTASDETARLINRCYTTDVFIDAVQRLKACNIRVTAHVIYGLPGETADDMMNTVKLVSDLGVDSIKMTCLYVLRGTVLEQMYNNKEFEVLGMEEYFDIVDKALDIIPSGMCVMRLTGDGPKKILIAPEWTKDKRAVINYINRRFGDG